MKCETTYRQNKTAENFKEFLNVRKNLNCMLLPLDFEMLRPLIFFLERKKMFVGVEKSEVIFLCLRGLGSKALGWGD